MDTYTYEKKIYIYTYYDVYRSEIFDVYYDIIHIYIFISTYKTGTNDKTTTHILYCDKIVYNFSKCFWRNTLVVVIIITHYQIIFKSDSDNTEEKKKREILNSKATVSSLFVIFSRNRYLQAKQKIVINSPI